MSHQPVNTWGLDTQFSCYRKLLIGHLKALKIVQHGMCFEFYLANRSIQRAEVAGYVVSKKVASKKVTLYLDDGSGIVQCSKFYDEADYEKSLPFASVSLGDMVAVRGRIIMFNEELVLWAASVDKLTDPNAELLHWVTAMHLYQTCYRQPFVFSGPRPWIDTSPFAYCTCLSSRNRTVCRQEFIYCPCQPHPQLSLHQLSQHSNHMSVPDDRGCSNSSSRGSTSKSDSSNGMITAETDHSTRVDSNDIFGLMEANRAEFNGAGAGRTGGLGIAGGASSGSGGYGIWTYSDSAEMDVDISDSGNGGSSDTTASTSAYPSSAGTKLSVTAATPITTSTCTPWVHWSFDPQYDDSYFNRFVSAVLLGDGTALGHFSCFLLHHLYLIFRQQEVMQTQAPAHTAAAALTQSGGQGVTILWSCVVRDPVVLRRAIEFIRDYDRRFRQSSQGNHFTRKSVIGLVGDPSNNPADGNASTTGMEWCADADADMNVTDAASATVNNANNASGHPNLDNKATDTISCPPSESLPDHNHELCALATRLVVAAVNLLGQCGALWVSPIKLPVSMNSALPATCTGTRPLVTTTTGTDTDTGTATATATATNNSTIPAHLGNLSNNNSTDYRLALNTVSGVILPTLKKYQREAIRCRIPKPDHDEYVLEKTKSELTGSPYFIPHWRITFCWRDHKRQSMRR